MGVCLRTGWSRVAEFIGELAVSLTRPPGGVDEFVDFAAWERERLGRWLLPHWTSHAVVAAAWELCR